MLKNFISTEKKLVGKHTNFHSRVITVYLLAFAVTPGQSITWGQETGSLVCICQDTFCSPFSTARKHTCIHRCTYSIFKLKKSKTKKPTKKEFQLLNHSFSLGFYFSHQAYNTCNGSRN